MMQVVARIVVFFHMFLNCTHVILASAWDIILTFRTQGSRSWYDSVLYANNLQKSADGAREGPVWLVDCHLYWCCFYRAIRSVVYGADLTDNVVCSWQDGSAF